MQCVLLLVNKATHTFNLTNTSSVIRCSIFTPILRSETITSMSTTTRKNKNSFSCGCVYVVPVVVINVKKILAVINATYAVAKRKPEKKKIRLAGIRTLTSAIPVQRSNQLSYQANWELVIKLVRNIPGKDEDEIMNI